MDTLAKNITDIAIAEVKLINEKIKGLNFLEILKNNLIEKIRLVINNQNFPLENFENFVKDINISNRNLKISIKYYTNSSIIRKKIIEKNTLFIFFNEACSLDIFKDDKNFINILLYKNTGISISENTTINSKFNKNTLIIEIENKDEELILTN